MEEKEIKYVFVTNINNTGFTGVINIVTQELICICNETKGKKLVEILNSYNTNKKK